MDKKTFGMEKRKSEYDIYLGTYIIVNPHGSNKTYAGKLEEILDSGNGILSPFQTVDYNQKGPIRKIIKDHRKRGITIPLQGSIIEPTTRKKLNEYNIYWNRQDMETKKDQDDLKKLKHKIANKETQ
ncbi:MAG: hypothetical protein WDZ62_01515 [Candidatus Pacearchaeota archaeon]